MAYIGLISDTHGTFDAPLKEFLKDVDVIWHAGDFGNIEIVDNITAFKPLIGAYGNCDPHTVRLVHPVMRYFRVEEKKVLITHIGGFPGHYDRYALSLINSYKPDIFVCGHSHILRVMNDKLHNMLVLNPGAAGIQGFHQVRTALRFRIEGNEIKDMEVGEWERRLVL